MTSVLKRHREGIGAPLTGSLLLHLLAFLVASRLAFFAPPRPDIAPLYYVDVVTLPVASPQAGAPGEAAIAPAPLPPATPAPREMSLPPKPTSAPPTTPAPKAATTPSQTKPDADDARSFTERLTRIERENEARHQAAAIESLQKRLAGRGGERAGMPAATGNEAGSDYAAYIQSRLSDAFRSTIAYATKKPEVYLRLTIARSGRIDVRLERSSGDRLFEDSVLRAISRAEKNLPPPPGGTDFEHGFVFRPQGIERK